MFQVAEAFAQQVTGWAAVPNATVRVFRIDDTGAPVGTTLIPDVTTAIDGSFSLTLPTGTVLDSTLVAQVESDPGITGPVAVGTANTYSALLVQTTVALNPAVEAATQAIVNDPAPLANFSNAEVTQILSGISTLVAQNPPAGNVTAVTTSFGAAITSAVTATSGTTAGAPVILTNNLSNGTAGTAYAAALVAVGGTGTLTWSLDPTSGPLPNGVTLATNGQLSGTPQQNGSFALKIRVTDAANPAQSATKDLVLTIAQAAVPSITTTSPLPNGAINQAYSKTFAATGGTGTLTWTSTGALPSGVTLSPGGILSGTPQAGSENTYNISVTVTDSTTPVGQTDTKPFALTITTAPQPPTITTTSLPNGTVSTAYNQILVAAGGTTPYTWSVVSGPLAPLALSAAGVISGTPTAAATLLFTVQVTDANNLTAQQALSITITNSGNTVVPNSWTVVMGPTSGNVENLKSATATYNPQNELIDVTTSFGQLTRYERGTMAASEVYSDQFVKLSRWNNGAGQHTFESFVNALMLSANQGVHNASGIPKSFATLPSSGIETYTVVASTKPTFADGSAAPGTSVTGTVQVNWTGVVIGTEPPTKKVSFTLTVNGPNGAQTFVSGGSITDPTNFELGTISNDGSVGGNGFTSCSCSGTISGTFFGANAERLALGIRASVFVTGVGSKELHAMVVLARPGF